MEYTTLTDLSEIVDFITSRQRDLGDHFRTWVLKELDWMQLEDPTVLEKVGVFFTNNPATFVDMNNQLDMDSAFVFSIMIVDPVTQKAQSVVKSVVVDFGRKMIHFDIKQESKRPLN